MMSQELPNLKTLQLFECKKLQKFNCLGNLKYLEKLYLGDTSIADDDLTYLANKLL
jgi:hypothetical protein